MTAGRGKRGALRQAPRRSAQLLELDLTIERLQSRLARTHDERARDIARQQEVIDGLRESSDRARRHEQGMRDQLMAQRDAARFERRVWLWLNPVCFLAGWALAYYA